MSVTEMFSYIQAFLSAAQEIRGHKKSGTGSGTDGEGDPDPVPKCPSTIWLQRGKCAKAKELFCTVRTQLGELKNKFPVEQYYRFHEHWRFVLQRLAFLAAFEVYLEIEVVRKKEFHLDVEDYLAGVLIMASELSRLAVNSITAGDYGRPLRISKELDSGFRLLNLKNDPLRKRYDDLSIRGLTKE